MIGIKEILNKLEYHTPLSFEEKMMILNYKKANMQVINYLKNILKGLFIEITDDYEGALFGLMKERLLEGWCWQTTESSIVFFPDNDYIERGYLKFGYNYPDYYHSWLSFNFENKEYVFDPCLNILCLKEDYYKTFSVNLLGKVSSLEVKKELFKQISLNNNLDEQPFFDELTKEVILDGEENVNTPFYLSSVGYRLKSRDGQIKKLVAHYYPYD